MIAKLASAPVQQFIRDHENDDPFELSLRHKEVDSIPIREVAKQITARKKAKTKLPEWYWAKGVIWPPLLSMEQCSSELAAKYKASLISGKTLIDLTGGAGIDTFYLSKVFKQVIYVEKNSTLCETANHNFNLLKAGNIQIYNTSAEDFINTHKPKADVIFIDPARRDKYKNKVFNWADCEPNILTLQNALFKLTNKVLIKASPMLDITASLHALDHVSRVIVVAIKNECKEVLYLLEKDCPFKAIKTVNLSQDKEEVFNFGPATEQNTPIAYSKPLTYLYEPNAAILKAGAFKSVGSTFGLNKLHVHTHLYTSGELVPDFPGRTFKILACTPYNKKAVLKLVPGKKANITVRNFPEDVNQIRKKTGIKPGGNLYLFGATTVDEEKLIVITEKV